MCVSEVSRFRKQDVFLLINMSNNYLYSQTVNLLFVSELVVSFVITVALMSPAVPAPPAKFPPSLSALRGSSVHLHSIRIIIPRNPFQSSWEVRGTKHIGYWQSPPPSVIISHLAAAASDKDCLGRSHVQPTDKNWRGLMWLRCIETTVSVISEGSGSTSAPPGTGGRSLTLTHSNEY